MDSIDDNDYILKEVRMKYAEILEELLECPVCLDIPNGQVNMCINGHHLCLSCQSLLINIGDNKCPTCQQSFSSCRNLTVEKLCETFNDIRNSILDPRHASNRRVVKNKTSVYIQTEDVCVPTIDNNNSSTEFNKKNSIEKSDSVNESNSQIKNTNNNVELVENK